MSVDPELLATWTRGWARTRGAPAPVWDDGAWRIDVGQPEQVARYVFASADEAVRGRGARIDEPAVFIKVCAGPEAVAPLLGSQWSVARTGWTMTLEGTMGPVGPLAEGYSLATERRDGVTLARVLSGGEEAARGRMVVIDGRIVFDRIATEPGHRRRGLARWLLRALEEDGRSRGGRDGVLVATDEGRALYETVGWRALGPYTTAVIPA